MKRIVNKTDSYCSDCQGYHCAELVDGRVLCEHCGSPLLLDRTGQIFQPLFAPARMYRASRYTPPRPDRRHNSRPWPKHKERRHHE